MFSFHPYLTGFSIVAVAMTDDKSLQELGVFLQKLVNDDKLEFSAGLYSLQKK